MYFTDHFFDKQHTGQLADCVIAVDCQNISVGECWSAPRGYDVGLLVFFFLHGHGGVELIGVWNLNGNAVTLVVSFSALLYKKLIGKLLMLCVVQAEHGTVR